ncbi:MAG TPA: ATP synthase F1 subunit delta [Candidatus Magasanikbacteria bacterium]|nr:ATP synthase F1 subunit delta [Candidatus Magasanikbacteria bacterium]
MAKIFPQQFAKILYELTNGLPNKDIPAAIDSFISFLAKNQSIKKLPYIISEFEKYAQKMEGKEEITVKSAHGLSENLLNEIKKNLNLQGEVKEEIDESILGGVVVTVGNKIFDASVKTQINKLKQQLI